MARPEEKSQSMLHRYLRSRAGEDGQGPGSARRASRRPYLATLCEDVDEAEKWRRQVLHDISRKVTDIQNPGLGEARTRELNDEINKLLREKRHWERRIRDLGGRNYAKDPEGRALLDSAVSHKGYFYFGAARELPGVAALLSSHSQGEGADDEGERDDTPIGELLARVDPGRYYGYEDAELAAQEAAREEKDRKQLIAEWDGAGKPGVDDGPRWDPTEWEAFVGKPPPTGAEIPEALKRMELSERKREVMAQLAGMSQK